MDKKKRFENPELEIVEFTNDDIITESGAGSFNDPNPQQGDNNGWW